MLLAHLAGNPDPRFPGGFGGGGPGSISAADEPQRRSIHQQAADLIAEDEHINRSLHNCSLILLSPGPWEAPQNVHTFLGTDRSVSSPSDAKSAGGDHPMQTLMFSQADGCLLAQLAIISRPQWAPFKQYFFSPAERRSSATRHE